MPGVITSLVNDQMPLLTEGVRFLPRVSRGLLGWWDFGGSIDLSRLRRAPYADPPIYEAAIGSPQAFDNRVLFDGGANFFETSISETPTMTMAFGGYTTDDLSGAATRPCFLGNFASADTTLGRGIGFYASGVNGTYPVANCQAVASYLDTDGVTVINRAITAPVADITKPTFWIITVEEGVGISIYNMTAGQTTFFAETRQRVVRSYPMRLGSGTQGNNGTSYQTTAMLFNVALTETERNALYAAAKLRASLLPTPMVL